LSTLGDLTVCVVAEAPPEDGDRADVLARAALVQIPPPPKRRTGVAAYLLRRSPWWDPWGDTDLEAARGAMQAELGRDAFDVVWAYTPVLAPLLSGWSAAVRILDLPDLPAVNRRRAYRQASPQPALKRLVARYTQGVTTRALRRAQDRACSQASLVTVCSETDREQLRRHAAITVVPNGYKRPPAPVGRLAVSGDPTLVFQGTMSTDANRDGAVFFAQHVLPLVRDRLPNAQFRIVGNADVHMRGLAEPPGVVVVGQVDRIEDELAKAHAVVVPLRIGSGTRLKILEAWAHRIPVVATTVGAEGLPASDGVDLLLADTPAALADACVKVLTDHDLRAKLMDAGQHTFERNYEWTEVQDRFLATVSKVLPR
jgi:glycosyltransferase involved in cell wall biosynthesis